MTSEVIYELAEGWIKHVHAFREDKNTDGFAWAWDKAYDLRYEDPASFW